MNISGKIKLGITGSNGFMGGHLRNHAALLPSQYTIVPFDRQYFIQPEKLAVFASECDAIIHLAGLNRGEEQVVFDENTNATKALIHALESVHSRCHVLFPSSPHEFRDTAYGRSKVACRHLLAEWAERNNAVFTGLIVPNTFGPFAKPFHNSFVATFCHQLTHGQIPSIDSDGDVGFIYIEELIDELFPLVQNRTHNPELPVKPRHRARVSQVLEMLSRFKKDYIDHGHIPQISKVFERLLFNTLRSYMEPASRQFFFDKKTDSRGFLSECLKANIPGQIFYSFTKPGITRGNHFHTQKIERFIVIKGEAVIKLRQIGSSDIAEYQLSGERPSAVDMPVWTTHNIINVGKDDLITLFWSDQLFDPDKPDTYPETV